MSLEISDQEKSPLFLCASLVGETKRQTKFANNFKDQSLFKFINSIDGRGWSESDADQYCSPEMIALRKLEKLKGESWLSPAAIACALTHRKLMSYAENNSFILCEDDAVIDSDFISLWCQPNVRQQFEKCDGPVLLHYISKNPITVSPLAIAKIGTYSIYKLDDLHVSSSACMFLPKQIAKRIREYQTPVQSSADHWSEMKKNGVFNHIYAVYPPPAQVYGFASTLGYQGSLRSNNFLIILARRVKRILQRRRKNFYETLEIKAKN